MIACAGYNTDSKKATEADINNGTNNSTICSSNKLYNVAIKFNTFPSISIDNWHTQVQQSSKLLDYINSRVLSERKLLNRTTWCVVS